MSPNPKRVAAGRRNRQRRGELTPSGRERLRKAALGNQPWRQATGPRTDAGKARAAANGKRRQLGGLSVRELRDCLSILLAEVDQLRDVRGNRSRLAGSRAGWAASA